MGKKLDLTGQTFGRLTVLSEDGRNKPGDARWRCDCGAETAVTGSSLRSGNTQSCGCLQREVRTIHGKCYTPEYQAYRSMLKRCYNPNSKNYHHYGGRKENPITVCDTWRGENGFQNFYADMGDRPGKGYSLERKNNNAGYSKTNCCGGTWGEQANNRRSNVTLTYSGVTRTLAQWARSEENTNAQRDIIGRLFDSMNPFASG